MPGWKIHEVVQEFQKTFQSAVIVMTGEGVNISGVATIRRTF